MLVKFSVHYANVEILCNIYFIIMLLNKKLFTNMPRFCYFCPQYCFKCGWRFANARTHLQHELKNLEKWENIFQLENFEQTGKVGVFTQNTGKVRGI